MEVRPEVLEELLRVGSNGPLKNVEDVILPDPWPPIASHNHSDRTKLRRGPKSFKEWVREVRWAWRHVNDEEQLAKSWLSLLPPVQN